MKFKLFFILFLIACCIYAQDYTVLQVKSSNQGYGLLINFEKDQYIATPSHVIFSNIQPKVELNNKAYEVKEILLSTKRDLALLKLANPIDKYAISLSKQEKFTNKTFEFKIEETNLKHLKNLNINDLQGFSGYIVFDNGKIGLFQGCLVNSNREIVKFIAINLENLTDEFQIVDFSLIKDEFNKKNLKK